jgi:hypothetical protein
MDSNTLNDSVQDEQIGKQNSSADITNDSSLTPKVNTEKSEAEETVVTLEHSDTKLNEHDEYQLQHEQVLLPEDLAVPEELNDDDEGEVDEMHVKKAEADYSNSSKEELVAIAATLLKEKPIETLKADFEVIKVQFYKKHKADAEKKRKEYLEKGGLPEAYVFEEDEYEVKLKDILKKYRELKADFNRKTEAEKEGNLKLKFAIVEEIKVLINGNESLNDTYQQFRELQKKWRSIGPVPQQSMNDLWESYNHHVEKFYDFIKINNELRDLDLKKNLEVKIEICEKAEELILEPSVVKAFKQLQEFHNKWRDVGPVPHEMRADIWNRFKEITSKINKRHQDYFESQKVAQEKNLEAKSLLCDKTEDILKEIPATMKDWEAKSKELIEIQNVWKTIGFAPKKDNNRIYQRFRAACDNFFKHKREFFNKIKEEQNNNFQLKTDLCVQAESLMNSNEWKKSTEDLINIQKKWKEIGPVPRKYSDQIWKRFRAACDTFFNNKSAHFATVDSKFVDNLKLKLALIEQIENYQILENVDENFTNLKEFQRKWTEIGFVPIQQKEEIQTRYRNAINKLFDSIKIDEPKRKLMKFKNKIEQMPHNHHSDVKINRDRDKFIIRLKKLESDIVLWENNIGFFAKTKNAESMINDVQTRIDEAKSEIKVLEEKIRMIDKM